MEDKQTAFRIDRLRELIDQSGKTRHELAGALGCDNSTITKHYNGDRAVTTEYLAKYARYFGVSADYLLGLSDVKTTDTDLHGVCQYTGLSEKAVETLNKKRGNFLFSLSLSYLINSELFPMLKEYLLSDTLRDYCHSKYDDVFPVSGNVIDPNAETYMKEAQIDAEQRFQFAGIIEDISYYKDELYEIIKKDPSLEKKVLLANASESFDYFRVEETIAKLENQIKLLHEDLEKCKSGTGDRDLGENFPKVCEKAIKEYTQEIDNLKNMRSEIESGLPYKPRVYNPDEKGGLTP